MERKRMAQKKQANREARKAAQEAAQRAREEQAAKERKQQTIIGVVVIAIVLILGIIAGVAVYKSLHPDTSASQQDMSEQDAYTALQNAENKPKHADDKGGILISSKGYDKKVENAPTIGIYMDFLCPGCGNLNRTLDADLVKMMKAGQINLDLHFMSFMDRLSSDEYSTRAANAALYIAEHDENPDHLLSFVTNMYKDDFQPEEGSGYKSVSDDQIRHQALQAGVDSDVANNALQRNYDKWLNASNTYTPKRPELWNKSGQLKGSMSTPTVTINGYFWDMNDLSIAKLSIPDGFLESIGLPKDKVGVKGAMPSIGAKGKPISVTTGE